MHCGRFRNPDPLHRYPQPDGLRWTTTAAGHSSDDCIDVSQFQPTFVTAVVDRLGGGLCEALIHVGRFAEAEHVVVVDEADCGAGAFALVLGNVRPGAVLKAVVVAGPVAQQCGCGR